MEDSSKNRAETSNEIGFQERVKEVLDAIQKDKFSELTRELYDQKKGYLMDNLIELSTMYNELQDNLSKNQLGFSEKQDLQKRVDILNRLITDRDTINQNLRSDLNNVNQRIQSYGVENYGWRYTVAVYGSTIYARDILIWELNTRYAQLYDDFIALKARENDWEGDFERLEIELENKNGSVDDLGRQLEEMATRLSSVQEVKDGLIMRVAELEREAEKVNREIAVRDEEKREAIRQLTASLEHYKTRYEEVCKAYIAKNWSAGCFDFMK